jgi:glycosyltransferase involved in cell wall biosynthesis
MTQTCQEWKAIIVFDGIEPTMNVSDPRFQIIQSPKSDLSGKGGAGHVRNYGIHHATTEWVAFVDDDDAITQDYVERFLEESSIYQCDLIIFRMVRVEINSNQYVFIMMPSPIEEDFCISEVGISFAVKKSVFDSGFVFETGEYEDFYFLEKVRLHKFRMIISPYTLYVIRNYLLSTIPLAQTRVFINFPICVQRLN